MINPAMYLLILLGAIAVWLSFSTEWESIGKKISELFKKEEE